MVLFMGVDPGLINTGVGFVTWDGRKINYRTHAIISPPRTAPLPERLKFIALAIHKLAKEYKPHFAAVEGIFHSVNIKSALLLGQVRGVIIGSLSLCDINIQEFSALQIKQAVVGYGKAEKTQVKKMVELQLGISLDKLKFDISDALACAICLAIDQTRIIK